MYDFDLDISIGQEWLHGDMNFTFVLYRVDRQRTKKDDVYGEVVSEGVQYHAPVELKGYVQIESPTNAFMGSSETTLVIMKKKIELVIIPSLMMVVSPRITGTLMVVINHITAVSLRRRYQMMSSTESNGITEENKKDT